MSEDAPDVSITPFGDLSKPADTLIKKISKAVGGVWEPFQIKRIARAEAEAALIRADAVIQITDLHRRAAYRWIEEEAKRQQNIEDITAKALPHLDDAAKPEAVEDDWITNFFDKCRLISDEDMQKLWSRVLAGEANTPGKYSKRTVNALSDLDKTDTEQFTQLCRFGWSIGITIPLIFNLDNVIYQQHRITFGVLSHLDSIGLIRFGGLMTYGRAQLPRQFLVEYFGKALKLTMPKDEDNALNVGSVLLTSIGEQLAPLCASQPIDGFLEYVKAEWAQYLLDGTSEGTGASTPAPSEGA